MNYKKFKDIELSTLGMGNMRLPTVEGADFRGPFDIEKSKELIEYAYHHGINYFDTAYGYCGGQSEIIVGEVLNQYPRDSWYLATKMPGHALKPGDTPEKIFEEQLKKCQVEYFDFYLLHNMCEASLDVYMDEKLGIIDYLVKQKELGRIKYLGFSCHSRPDTLKKFLEYRNCYDFVQIQLNYLDWSLQDAKTKYEILTEYHLPIMVMEPTRGGRLINLDEEDCQNLKAARPDESIASWSFNYLRRLDNIQVVLSGMNTIEQLEDNIKTFASSQPLNQEEIHLLDKIVEKLVKQVPCTACRYCTSGCPKNLDIPKLMSIYNEISFDHSPGLTFTIMALEKEEEPSNCINCKKCVKACPQGIDIPKIMQELDTKIAKFKENSPFFR